MSSLPLRLYKSEVLCAFLEKAAAGKDLPQECRAEALEQLDQPHVSWSVLHRLAATLREQAGGDSGPWVHQLCAGSGLVLEPPTPKQKSPELQARLAKLQRQLDQRRYDEMVSDVTQAEREAQLQAEGGLQTYKEQLSYGLHVLVMMGTFYALGHVACTYTSAKPAVHAAGGLAGLVFAMLLETMLLIIRTNFPLESKAQRRLREGEIRRAGAVPGAGTGTVPELGAGDKKRV